MGTLDFFLLEGGEYLERLDALAQTPAGSFAQGDELLRLTRAYRGSAIMASQHGMARAAQGLEAVARAVRENRIPWSEATRGELIRAVDDCKILMRRLRTPDQGDTEKAEAIGIALDRLSGRASASMRAQAGPGLDAGGRAFVAREAASIASVLQNVARSLRADPANRDVLVSVPPAMSALRGVAILNDLPPLGDILSAIEHATKDVLASAGNVADATDAADMFEAGGKALGRAAREVVDVGRPDANAEESHAFSTRLFSALAGRGGVVSVDALFYDDAGPHIVSRGTAPAATGAGLARVEMVSHGEYLTAAAAELSRAETPVQRDLRLYGIAASVRPMMGASGSPLSNALGRLAEAARDAIGRGTASNAIGEFAAHLNKAAQALSSAQSGDETMLAERLTGAAAAIASLTARSHTVAATAPAEVPEVKPVVVSRISDPTMPRHEGATSVAPGASPAPPAPAAPREESILGPSYLTFERLIGDHGLPMGSLDELVGAKDNGAAAKAAPPPAAAPAQEPLRISQRVTPPRHIDRMGEQPVVPVQSLAPDDDVVPIESLVYSSDSALARLKELKAQLAEVTRAEMNDSARLAALIHEVFDLVELGLAPRR